MKLKFFIASFIVFSVLFADSNKKINPQDIPITEDLMREHGLLNRVLLVYEEIIKRIDKKDFPAQLLLRTVTIIQTFIEGYHEKIEEQYIFPIFEKNNKKAELTKTLRDQHTKGRAITAKLKVLCQSSKRDQKTLRTIKNLLKKFINMYRPHEAREDTELFPAVRSLITEAEFDDLGEKSEDLEYDLFGKQGFYGVLKQVEDIEKELGINNLAQFTPQS
jgi:hemerythrin-like domain-containing protein